MTEKKGRILFYYDNYCTAASRGGTEVATFRIAETLDATGHWEVYHAFLKGQQRKIQGRGTGDRTPYKEEFKISKGSLEKTLGKYISEHEIDAVVNMGRFFRQRKLKKAIEESGRDVKLLFMHHFAPGSERVKPTYKSGFHLLRMDPFNPLYWLRASVYPILRLPRMMNLSNIYREVYELSDAVVVLSDGYKAAYAEIARLDNVSKLTAIPNIFNPTDIDIPQSDRQKRVLILSRMDEIQKRISLALEVWRKIEDDPELSEWHLDIVGSGHDMKAIQSYSRTLGLNRIFFHGWKDGRYFMERASILMMTSLYEGLPLSLLEAQAYGVVPIVFDSYASVRDVIENEVNGIAISPFGDVDSFARRLSELMKSEELRQRLAEKGIEGSGRFRKEEIASRWISLLQSL